jgi:hypothetical protein
MMPPFSNFTGGGGEVEVVGAGAVGVGVVVGVPFNQEEK